MSFPDGLKFCFLYYTGVELLTPDMGVQLIHGGDRCNLDGAVVKVRDVAGAAICKDVDGAEDQPLIFGIHFIEDDRWLSIRAACDNEKTMGMYLNMSEVAKA